MRNWQFVCWGVNWKLRPLHNNIMYNHVIFSSASMFAWGGNTRFKGLFVQVDSPSLGIVLEIIVVLAYENVHCLFYVQSLLCV